MDKLINLEGYLARHGKHFTEKLALAITEGRWGADRIYRETERRVYYNVTGSTLGDMVYLVGKASASETSFRRCVSEALGVVGNFSYHDGVLFREWIKRMVFLGEGFDFSMYI